MSVCPFSDLHIGDRFIARFEGLLFCPKCKANVTVLIDGKVVIYKGHNESGSRDIFSIEQWQECPQCGETLYNVGYTHVKDGEALVFDVTKEFIESIFGK